MKMVQRDRKEKTMQIIKDIVVSLVVEDFNNHTIYSISQKNSTTFYVFRMLQKQKSSYMSGWSGKLCRFDVFYAIIQVQL
jgi:hypothetical protein